MLVLFCSTGAADQVLRPCALPKARRGDLVAYDIMEADGQDVRPEPLEERWKRLARLLSAKVVRARVFN